jgi:hypothetical protein
MRSGSGENYWHPSIVRQLDQSVHLSYPFMGFVNDQDFTACIAQDWILHPPFKQMPSR